MKLRIKFQKQQESFQLDIVKEINSKLDIFDERKDSLSQKYEKLVAKQSSLSERLTFIKLKFRLVKIN